MIFLSSKRLDLPIFNSKVQILKIMIFQFILLITMEIFEVDLPIKISQMTKINEGECR